MQVSPRFWGKNPVATVPMSIVAGLIVAWSSRCLSEEISAGHRFRNLIVGTSIENLVSSDIAVSELNTSVSQTKRLWSWRAELSANFFDLDYQPSQIDFRGLSKHLDEYRGSGQGTVRFQFPERWIWTLSSGGYDGFSDYRSLWLSEYYRQKYSPVIGYQAPDPNGWNIRTGARWAHQPAISFFELNIAYQNDVVAPAYEKPLFKPLVRRRDELKTWTIGLGAEQILSRRVRLRNDVQMTDTTERGLRFGWQGSANWSVAENWVIRGTVAASYELPSLRGEPDFASGSMGLIFERDWNQTWFANLIARYYHDTGQLNQSLPESTASPELDTVHAGFGLRWSGARAAVSLSAGPYWISYGRSTNPVLDPFSNLYRDRTWWSVETAYQYRF